MAGPGIPLALQIAGGVAAVGGTAASIVSANAAQRSQRKADAVGRAQAQLENKRAIRQAINTGRVQRAQLSAAGQNQTGGFSSSSIQGALGSASTQEAANIGFANQTVSAGIAINRNLGKARQSLANSASFGAVAALPGQFGITPFDFTKAGEKGTKNSGSKAPGNAPFSFRVV
jgi:hypothetical protein